MEAAIGGKVCTCSLNFVVTTILLDNEFFKFFCFFSQFIFSA